MVEEAEAALAEDAALDAYSRIVIAVAEKLSPSVANLQVRRRTRRGTGYGAGSGVVISPDGFLITSAHVVEGSRRGVASFSDGREANVSVVGADPLSDLADPARRRRRLRRGHARRRRWSARRPTRRRDR